MKVLHYSLGLPPYRSGGLVRYACDLMKFQVNSMAVVLLFPGETTFGGATRVKDSFEWEGVRCQELENPGPVPLLNGLRDPSAIGRPRRDGLPEVRFLERERPDIVHVHTLMGLSREFLEKAGELGIPVVFTAHDYFGLCLKTVLVDWKGEACDGPDPRRCAVCNQGSPGRVSEYLHSKKWLHRFKGAIRKLWPGRNSSAAPSERTEATLVEVEAFDGALATYGSMLRRMDRFHFASTVSRGVYEKLLGRIPSTVSAIAHGAIRDLRRARLPGSGPVRFGFIGDPTPFKGLPLLRECLREIRPDCELHIHGPRHGSSREGCREVVHGPYTATGIESVFDGMDLLVVPSLWHETFSLVTLEALCRGVPVLVSERVGAKDLFSATIPEMVFANRSDLVTKLDRIARDRSLISDLNARILELDLDLDFGTHARWVGGIYAEAVRQKKGEPCCDRS